MPARPWSRRHLDDDPLNNRWRPGSTDDEVRAAGGNLVYGTKQQNAQDKFRNGHAASRLRRLRVCASGAAALFSQGQAVPCPAWSRSGEQAAAMLRAGMNIEMR